LPTLKLKLNFEGEDELQIQVLTSKTALNQQGGDKRSEKHLHRSQSLICYGAHRHPKLGNPDRRTLGSFGGISTHGHVSAFLGCLSNFKEVL